MLLNNYDILLHLHRLLITYNFDDPRNVFFLKSVDNSQQARMKSLYKSATLPYRNIKVTTNITDSYTSALVCECFFQCYKICKFFDLLLYIIIFNTDKLFWNFKLLISK